MSGSHRCLSLINDRVLLVDLQPCRFNASASASGRGLPFLLLAICSPLTPSKDNPCVYASIMHPGRRSPVHHGIPYIHMPNIPVSTVGTEARGARRTNRRDMASSGRAVIQRAIAFPQVGEQRLLADHQDRRPTSRNAVHLLLIIVKNPGLHDLLGQPFSALSSPLWPPKWWRPSAMAPTALPSTVTGRRHAGYHPSPTSHPVHVGDGWPQSGH